MPTHATLDESNQIPTAVLPAIIPVQTGQNGKYLTTNGTAASWGTVSTGVAWGAVTGTLSAQTDLQAALDGKSSTSHTHTDEIPSQTGNSGKYLTTNGTAVSWGIPTAGAAWGNITGTLSAQTDLQSAMDGKSATSHNHTGTYEPAITKATGYATWNGSAWAFVNEAYSLTSHNHSGVYQPIATVLTNMTASFTTAQETKLSGIATGATANSSDATLLARANHTGTQAAGTITGLATVATSGSAADLTGNLAVARLNSGTEATASTYWCGNGTWATPAGGSVSGVSAVLTATQANSTVTPATLTSHSFTLPAGKTMLLNGQLVATAAATTTGLVYGVKVTNPTGANGNVQGSMTSYVNIASTAVATGLMDGDIFNVAANANATLTVIGSASTSGNNAAQMQCVLKNTSTNTNATVEVVFASEVATSAVTAQIGTGAAGMIF